MHMTDDASAMPFASPFGKLNDQVVDATRQAAKFWLDLYEQALESMASYQEQAASRTDIEWLSTAAETQAKLLREFAAQHVAAARGLLD
jgi:hypothetical protein